MACRPGDFLSWALSLRRFFATDASVGDYPKTMADSLQEQTADTAVQAAPQFANSPSDALSDDTQLAANPSLRDADEDIAEANDAEACDAAGDSTDSQLEHSDAVGSQTLEMKSASEPNDDRNLEPNPAPELELVVRHTLRADESTAPLDPVPVLRRCENGQENRESTRTDSDSQSDEDDASNRLDPLENVDASQSQHVETDAELSKSTAVNVEPSPSTREIADAQRRDRSSKNAAEQRVDESTKTPSERDRRSAAAEPSDETVTFQRRRKGQNIRRPTPSPAHPVIAQPGQRWWSDHFELSTWLGRGLWWMSFALAYVGIQRVLDPFASDTALAQVPYLAGAGWICALAILGSTIPKRFRWTALTLGIAHSALLAVAWVWRLDLLR